MDKLQKRVKTRGGKTNLPGARDKVMNSSEKIF